MDGLNSFLSEYFSQIKGLAFVGFFILMLALQVLIPYKRQGWTANKFESLATNLPLAGINTALFAVLCSACICKFSLWINQKNWGLMNWIGMGLVPRSILTVFILDFVAYTWHRANHHWPFLWRFHSVHHTDRNFTITTSVRFHTGELLISMLIRMLVLIVFGIPVMGLLVFEVIYHFFNIFEHANIRLPQRLENLLAHLFVTPSLHRKHHSQAQQELDSNFATIFSFWDHLGRTYIRSSSKEEITVGLPRQQRGFNLWQSLVQPFKNTQIQL